MFKLGCLVGTEWKEHSFSPVFERLESPTGASRILAGVPHGDAEVFERLASCLKPPYYLLYVLHTPRGEGDAGRYQSPELSAEQLRSFISRFKGFLSGDARFDIWIHSPEENATVVWDRHNLLYAYGPLEKFSQELRALGFSEKEARVPAPHQHYYRPEMDGYATDLLAAFEWSYTPLRSEDEQ